MTNTEDRPLTRDLTPGKGSQERQGPPARAIGFLRAVLLSEYFILYLTITYFIVVAGFFPDLATARNISNQIANIWPLLNGCKKIR